MNTIAFDFDGTLVSPENKQTYCLQYVARRYGYDIDPKSCWKEKQSGQSNITFLISRGVPKALAEKMSRVWRDLVETPYWSTYDTLFADVLPCLKAVKKTGQRAIILSARQNPHWLEQQIRRLRIHDYFDAIVCVPPQQVVAAKSQALQYYRADLFIGDAETDFEGAEHAGIEFSAVATGQRTFQFLYDWGIPKVYPSLCQAMSASMESS